MTKTEQPPDPAMPLVNLNGTDITDLMAQHLAVHRLSRRLLELVSAAAPHGRDYPHVGRGDATAARLEWEDIAAGVRTTHRWAEKRLFDLSRQNHERNGAEKAGQVVRDAEAKVTP